MLRKGDSELALLAVGRRRAGPYVRLKDRREKVRASCQLGANGEPELYDFDEDGADARSGNALDRLVAERGPAYQALLFVSVLVVSVLGGMWIARTASAASGSLTAALVTIVVLAALVGLLGCGSPAWLVTASSGFPNPTPRRVFTSTKTRVLVLEYKAPLSLSSASVPCWAVVPRTFS